MTERREQWRCLALTGKRKSHPGKDACRLSGLPRSQGQERTVSLLEPKVREECWESVPSHWALITLSVKWAC